MHAMSMNDEKKKTGGQRAYGTPQEEFSAAVTALGKAIELHEDHMSGKAPTTGADGEKSQMKMMALMQRAYAALMEAKKSLK
ncbi:hypothetical protein [Brevundimonas albigilva]|uniref:DUF1843 domain-containing protein n=1 Tax=Brevundimonas albigilva TaxID=1312364 RepID=A0ABY4SJK5_9CAUL|nr:hypothetical protein [Brevundimonas albigilva]URI15147.1 hypothetical protein M8231_15365 [Brevundimonas albigilva]